nr:MAG: ORF1 [Torque teno midi virus]
MPFWWNRRRKPWWGRWRRRWTHKRPKRRRRRRYARRRNRRPYRRRRKRKYKVRRKLKKITLKQWQPDSIKKCKIKGYSCLVLGAHGRQMYCYTNEEKEYIQPKAPAGGGFGCEVFNLKWLYSEYTAHNNIWTASNDYKDLCRYTGAKITLYRHPTVDWVISYDNMPPFDIHKYTYPEIQPQNLLLQRHKKVLLSQRNNPKGKLKVTLKIKPPKQMVTKWFFQKEFAKVNLFKLTAAAADFSFPRIAQGAQSTILTINSLNMGFYHNSTWAKYQEDDYKNISTQSLPLRFTYWDGKADKIFDYDPKPTQPYTTKYYYSVSYECGLFNPKVLFAKKVEAKQNNAWIQIANLPMTVLRYNPQDDTGHGNEVYLTSILTGQFKKPTETPDFNFNGVPLYFAFYGFYNYLQIYSQDKNIFKSHMFVVKSPALRPLSQATPNVYYPILNPQFPYGKLPWDEYITSDMKKLWYPTAEHQTDIINSIVCCGPFIPKLSNLPISTWELNYKYEFFFKWGGPQITDPAIQNPETRAQYPVPDKQQSAVQIVDPEKQEAAAILHDWDFRRGFITQTALKRMSENLRSDTSFESDSSEPPKKKKKPTKELQSINQKEEKIKKCLLSLCEKDTCQEQTQDLELLIKHQQLEQQQLKKNILRLLTHLKKNQACLQLQTQGLE